MHTLTFIARNKKQLCSQDKLYYKYLIYMYLCNLWTMLLWTMQKLTTLGEGFGTIYKPQFIKTKLFVRNTTAYCMDYNKI